jgi:hypothetical protein
MVASRGRAAAGPAGPARLLGICGLGGAPARRMVLDREEPAPGLRLGTEHMARPGERAHRPPHGLCDTDPTGDRRGRGARAMQPYRAPARVCACLHPGGSPDRPRRGA